MRVIPCCLLIVHIAAGAAYAQTFNDLQIRLGPYILRDDGGEQPVSVRRSTGPVVIGKPVPSTFSVGESCEAFTVSSDGSLRESATAAWKIEVTPTRVVRDAVSFRVRWQMATARPQGNRLSLEFGASSASSDELELTLRPGESYPIITLRNIHRYSCGNRASIRVSVEHYPWEGEERRLVVADLWLVERLSNGTEAQRSQALAVRGLPNCPFPFYFDRITDGNTPLDIFGTLIARLESGALAVSFETRCRWGDSGDSPIVGPQRFVRSEVQVKPEEIVEIRLPMLGDDAGPFAKREFSIRIRARQLR